MAAVATGGFAPDPDRDPALEVIMRALAAMPRKDRHEILAFLDFWRDLSRERRAMLAKAVKPELTDQQVGRLVGRTPRQLRRWTVYKRLKGKQADLRDDRRFRGFSDPDSPDA